MPKIIYKGFIPDPKIYGFLIGRIVDIAHTPFSEAQLLPYLNRKLLHTIKGIDVQGTLKYSLKPYSSVDSSIKIKCNRCLNEELLHFVQFFCKKCQAMCVYCRKCINMGRISVCTKLLSLPSPTYENHQYIAFGMSKVWKTKHSFRWGGTLTPLQQKASIELAESLQAKREHIVHAVCGAGKTELLFAPIDQLLQQGKRICVATPRTDVVLELFPRFRQAFPDTNVQALYGGAALNIQYSPLLLATTHQLYRFQQAFDAVIVDEADAFPYIYDETLQQAVQKAKKKNAAVAYVTATPSPLLKRKMEQNAVSFSMIPKRFHNFPLPIPQNRSLLFYELQIKKGYLPKRLKQWLHHQLIAQRPYLLFFPTIELMNTALPLVQQIDPTAMSVHAQDEKRKEKVMLLRQEKVNGLLTTTILERGVTIKNVQVAVIGAEQSIFNANALIQIAGRVGRNIAYPNGEVLFFHHGITYEMDRAIRTINNHNSEANF